MKQIEFIESGRRSYATPSVQVWGLGLCFPVCLHSSDGATTENYTEEDVWNL